jgi:hypothetical protein
MCRHSYILDIITESCDDSEDIKRGRSSLVSQVNEVLCYFGKLSGVDRVVKLELMTTFCNSLYGSELWGMSQCEIEDVCISWRKALKGNWNVPLNTHIDLPYNVSDMLPLKDELHR